MVGNNIVLKSLLIAFALHAVVITSWAEDVSKNSAVSASPAATNTSEQESSQNQKSSVEENKNRKFAEINGEKISEKEFLFILQKGIRERFFHGKVNKDEMDAFKQNMVDKLVEQTILSQEARRRKLQIGKPERERIERKLTKFDNQYTKMAQWQEKRDEALATIKKQLEREALMKALEQQVKDVAKPSVKAQQQYYNKNLDKFTAPEEWHVSIIMLKVDPSSPSETWQDTTDFAVDLVDQLHDGAEFEEMAYIHSGDDSAMNGGDMGYIHIGMLAKPAQEVLNLMDINQISEPVFLLQGVAIFRLNGIKGSRLNDYEKVKERVEALLKRQIGEESWGQLIKDLKQKSKFKINEKVVQAAMSNG